MTTTEQRGEFAMCCRDCRAVASQPCTFAELAAVVAALLAQGWTQDGRGSHCPACSQCADEEKPSDAYHHDLGL